MVDIGLGWARLEAHGSNTKLSQICRGQIHVNQQKQNTAAAVAGPFPAESKQYVCLL